MEQRSFSYWVDLIVRRRAIALEVGTAVLGLVVLITFLCPPTYRSTAKILVQGNRAQYLVSPELQGSAAGNQRAEMQPITQVDLNFEAELLTSVYLVKGALAGLVEPHNLGVGSLMMSVMNLALSLPVTGYDTLHHAPDIAPRDAWALKLSRHLLASH